MALPTRVVALEEHCVTPHLKAVLDGLDSPNLRYTPDFMEEVLVDLDDRRIADMDRLGLDVQVLSIRPPGAQLPDAPTAVAEARRANDAIAAAIDRHPTRFAGFATLPLIDPAASATELARCVDGLGFVGAIVHGRVHSEFLDHPALDPVLRAAADLDVPIFLHPGEPDARVRDVWFDHLDVPAATAPAIEALFASAAWGWHIETGTHLLRCILSGVFDRYPALQLIIGHWGEMVPWWIHRVDAVMSGAATHLRRRASEYLLENVTVTPSGLEWTPQLEHTLAVMGPDRVMFATDYPFVPGTRGRAFLDEAPIDDEAKAKIAHRNADARLRLPAAARG